MRLRKLMAAAVVGLGLGCLSGAAHADTIVPATESIVQQANTYTNGSGNYTRYDFTMEESGTGSLKNGDFFILYDVKSFVGFVNTGTPTLISNGTGGQSYAADGITGASWTTSTVVDGTGVFTTGVGTTNPTLSQDPTGGTNVKFTFNAPSGNLGGTFAGPISNILTFSMLTTAGGIVGNSWYGSQDHSNDGSIQTGLIATWNQLDGSRGPTPVPLALWGGLSLFGCVAGKRFYKKSAASIA